MFSGIQRSNKGFSVVELLVVIFIISLIATISFAGIATYGQRQQFEQFVSEVNVSIMEIRQQALSSQNGTGWGVYVSPATIEFFSGPTVTPGAASNVIIPVPEYVIATSSFNTGDWHILFAERVGTPSATGTITLVDTRTVSTSTITIEAGGLVE